MSAVEELESELKNLFESEYRDKALELWKEVASEHGIEYKIKTDKSGRKTAVPVNERAAKEKHFGSAATGVKATFWFDKAKYEFQQRVGEIDEQ